MRNWESHDEFMTIDDIDYRVKYSYLPPFKKFSNDPCDQDDFADFQIYIGEYDITNILSDNAEEIIKTQIKENHYEYNR